jgi:2-keto-3-deoxy-L-arabinonate dehydratase
MRISGVCPVLSVPFDDRGALDLPSFRNLVRWVQSLEVQGTRVQSVMLFGVASENHKLRDEEREQLLLALLQERADQPLTIIASVADHSGELAVERAQRYQAIGADAINVLPPSFLSPTKDQVLAHIERVLQSVSVPVVVQHLPQAGGLEDVESLLPLHEAYPHFATIKCEANPPMESVMESTPVPSGSSRAAL